MFPSFLLLRLLRTNPSEVEDGSLCFAKDMLKSLAIRCLIIGMQPRKEKDALCKRSNYEVEGGVRLEPSDRGLTGPR